MSETPIFTMPSSRAEHLSDWDIENPGLDRAERFDLFEDDFDPAPPLWDGPTFTHEAVQAPTARQVEAQPSIVEQHDRMTDEQNIAYIGAITPHVALARRQALDAAA
jgi:hypothetical protein